MDTTGRRLQPAWFRHPRRRPRYALVALTLVLGLSLAVGTVMAQTGVTVTLGKTAKLVEGGQAVLVEVAVACPAGWDVLEAFVYVTQDDGQIQSPFAPIAVRCTGRSEASTVRVLAYPDTLFHRGQAYASAYVLVQDPVTGATASGGASRTIIIR